MMMLLLRSLMCGAALAFALPIGAASAVDEMTELSWEQLIPAGPQSTASGSSAWGIVQHDQLKVAPLVPEDGAALVSELNGKRVRLSGFIVPLELEGDLVKTFLLVPYYGACIHVPPPPPNQIVYVDSEDPVRVRAAFDPISVVGTLTASAQSTELADVGYRIAADEVAVYIEKRPRFLFQVQ